MTPRQGPLRTKRIMEMRVIRRVRENMPARASFCLRGTRERRRREMGIRVTIGRGGWISLRVNIVSMHATY